MSYILDALKKSENERRAGGLPGMVVGASYVVSPSSASRHRGVVLLAGAGMLVTGLAVGHLRPWEGNLTAGHAGKSVPRALEDIIPPLVSQSVVQAGVGSTDRASGMLPGAGQALLVAQGLAPSPAIAVAVMPSQTEPPGLVVVAPKKVVTVALPAPVPVPVSMNVVRNVPGAKTPAVLVSAAAALPVVPVAPVEARSVPAVSGPPPAKAITTAAASTSPAVAAKAPVVSPVAVTSVPPVASPGISAAKLSPQVSAERVVAYRELPAELRSELPNIVFGGFAGGGESEGRIAFINSRLVREGEEVSPGLKLETVDQDGVVLAYQGHRFRASH